MARRFNPVGRLYEDKWIKGATIVRERSRNDHRVTIYRPFQVPMIRTFVGRFARLRSKLYYLTR